MNRIVVTLALCVICASTHAQTYVKEFDAKKKCTETFLHSVALPEGNWKVTVTLGSDKQAGNTTIRTESSRLMLENIMTKKGEKITKTFTVNIRNTRLEDGRSVKLKKDDRKLNWDDSLNFEFAGPAPSVRSIVIEPSKAPTVFLFGDSTVCDNEGEPYASWGQMVTAFFDSDIAFANYAESGETTNSCLGSRRFDKGLSQMKAGDYVFLEFGHNDEKQTRPGSGPWYLYSTNLKIMIDRVREIGAHPVLLTPTQRRRWNKDGGLIDSHGEFPDAMRTVAQRENTPLIDLTEMTTTMYLSLGDEASKALLVHIPAGSVEGLTRDIKDNTHFSAFGAYQVAKCVTQGIYDKIPELARHIKEGWTVFDPSKPDSPESFIWAPRPFYSFAKPRGN